MWNKGRQEGCDGMSVSICGHVLTDAELSVLNAVTHYMVRNAGDSRWNNCCSPLGNGREIPVSEIFPACDSQDNANRRTIRRLADLGVLAACEIQCRDSMLKGVPNIFENSQPLGDATPNAGRR
jgi:hypothetical protein